MKKDLPNGADTETTVAARRQLMRSGLAATAVAAFGLVAVACGDDDDGDDGDDAGGDGGTTPRDSGTGTRDGGTGTRDTGAAAGPDADIEPLNALLTAEYKAITAYTAGAGLIGDAPSTDPLYALAKPITDIAVDFQSHHRLHAQALVDAIEELGGTPVDEADVAATFEAPTGLTDNPTITNVLKFAAGAERAAAVAYNQVLAGLEAAKYRFLATVIEGDESQHFIVLAALVLGLVKPEAKIATSTGDVVPQAFVSSYGGNEGLDNGFPNYFE